MGEVMRMPNPSTADAVPLPFQGRQESALMAPLKGELSAELTEGSVSALRREVAELRALILSQNALLEQIARQQAQARMTRSQEAALRRTVRMRAEELAERERLPRRAISGAILSTLRQLTGCRALGDVPAAKIEQAMRCASGWDMPGALRKIRRECGQ